MYIESRCITDVCPPRGPGGVPAAAVIGFHVEDSKWYRWKSLR